MSSRQAQPGVPGRRVGVFSRGLVRVPHLEQLLDAEELVFRPSAAQARDLDAVVGWGHKPTAEAARQYASQHDLPYVRLEDGFLRSVGLGPEQPPLSIVVDDCGIYYDARSPSRLEQLLGAVAEEDPLSDRLLLARAQRCRERIAEAELSKYNHTPTRLPASVAELDGAVLVVDQTRGDASVQQGGATAASFHQMLEAALLEYPYSPILVKTHPDVLAGRKDGYLTGSTRHPRVHLLAEDTNPVALLKHVRHVYVCSSQLGFEAVLLGKEVSCFGVPFYAGWGLTDDRVPVARRGRKRSVDELAAAALILYPRYISPVTGQRCEPEVVIQHLALQRAMFRANAARFYCFGFRLWKRAFVKRFLSSPDGQVRFSKSLDHARKQGMGPDDKALVWGSRQVEGLLEHCRAQDIEVCRVEDGFLRSVGLGSDLTVPASIVVDGRGVYYDPRSQSDLEHILQHTDFSGEELQRARALRERITATGISKYNFPSNEPLVLGAEPGQRVILVPGQVEDDASVRLGGQVVQTNEALLRGVRAANPDCYLLYKPHPDVVSGNRRGSVLPSAAAELCNQVVETVPIDRCLAAADEVHTLTSLVGFEALLRGLPVTTYGLPFYAGWGLTEDSIPIPRRRRSLTLDELVAGLLIRYPRYYSFEKRAFVQPEDILAQLEQQRANNGRDSIPVRAPRAVRQMRRLVSLAREVTRAS